MSEVTMYPKLERREWIFTPAPDPRDARIAELEAALAGAIDAGRGLGAVCAAHEQRAIAYEARIAELEAALDRIVLLCVESRKAGPYQLRGYMATIERLADGALMPFPEGDMTITVEELDA